MAWTLEQYNALNDAIAQGVTQVMYGNKLVIYRSLNEMLTLRNEMKKELGIGKNSPKRLFAIHDKGLNKSE
jgi:hypothetical protein